MHRSPAVRTTTSDPMAVMPLGPSTRARSPLFSALPALVALVNARVSGSHVAANHRPTRSTSDATLTRAQVSELGYAGPTGLAGHLDKEQPRIDNAANEARHGGGNQPVQATTSLQQEGEAGHADQHRGDRVGQELFDGASHTSMGTV